MKIGVFSPKHIPLSASTYIRNIIREIKSCGVDFVIFTESDHLPNDVDLYWDPRSMGGTPPYERLQASVKPLVVTVHGAAPLSVPAKEYYISFKQAIYGKLANLRNLKQWSPFYGRLAAVITVSAYAKREIQDKLHLNNQRIISIYHGVDHSLFQPATHAGTEPYLLHVAQYQPKKNVARLFSAYDQLHIADKPSLIAIIPGYQQKEASPGVQIISFPMDHERLVPLYQEALGFVFPSIHETFGMPIVEAMACGCPVITSDITACPEVAADAALLVDPYSTEEIASAMKRLTEDSDLRKRLSEKGVKRASLFTWKKSAEEHLKVFEEALSKT